MPQNRVVFRNKLDRRIHIMLETEDKLTTSSFHIEPGEQDSQTTLVEGIRFYFYWRADGNPSKVCKTSGCNPNNVLMPDRDIGIDLPSPDGRWVEQTV